MADRAQAKVPGGTFQNVDGRQGRNEMRVRGKSYSEIHAADGRQGPTRSKFVASGKFLLVETCRCMAVLTQKFSL
eukprot:11206068-Alexandrium_andersonii.AAC.1